MKKSKATILGGVILGAAVGAAAGILLTPESGKKLRNDVKKRVGEFYKFMVPKLRKIKRIGGKELEVFADSAFKSYVKSRKISNKEAAELKREAKKYLRQLKRHIR